MVDAQAHPPSRGVGETLAARSERGDTSPALASVVSAALSTSCLRAVAIEAGVIPAPDQRILAGLCSALPLPPSVGWMLASDVLTLLPAKVRLLGRQ